MDSCREQVVIDQNLILRIMERDEDALRALVDRHAARIQQVLARRFQTVLRDAEIEEALNFAAWKVWRYASRYDQTKGEVGAWFYKIAENEALDLIRARQTANLPLEQELPFRQRKPDDSSWAEASVIQQLRATIEALPDMQRRILQADLAAGGRADDQWLAGRLETTVNSIRVSRTKARGKLRMQLGGHQDFQEGSGQ